jgi:hypothetical protein
MIRIPPPAGKRNQKRRKSPHSKRLRQKEPHTQPSTRKITPDKNIHTLQDSFLCGFALRNKK